MKPEIVRDMQKKDLKRNLVIFGVGFFCIVGVVFFVYHTSQATAQHALADPCGFILGSRGKLALENQGIFAGCPHSVVVVPCNTVLYETLTKGATTEANRAYIKEVLSQPDFKAKYDPELLQVSYYDSSKFLHTLYFRADTLLPMNEQWCKNARYEVFTNETRM